MSLAGLVEGALALLGLGAVVAWEVPSLRQRIRVFLGATPAAVPRAQLPLPPQAMPLLPAAPASISAAPAAPASATPTAAAAALPAGPIFWSKASIILAKQPDPYNKSLAALTEVANEGQTFNSNDATGQLYNGIRSVIGAVPVVGTAVNVLFSFFDWLGPFIVGNSTGGYDYSVNQLTRQTGAVFLLPVQQFPTATRYFPSQAVDQTAPTARPSKYQVGPGTPNPNYEAQYRAWLRRYLMEQAYAAEWFRITHAPDDPMLPAVVINTLWDAKLWPPPIEPMPLTTVEFMQRYAGTKNPAQNYGYSEGDGYGPTAKILDYQHTSAADQAADLAIAKQVYADLYAAYMADAQQFAAVVTKAQMSMPADLRDSAINWGMVPRWGSPANPLK